MDYTIKARPTIYRGQQMRSRLEAKFAQRCDELGIPWEYEPVCFAGRAGQYLPDFKLIAGETTVYVDTKPTAAAAADVLDRMRIVWDSEPDAVLAGMALVSPSDYEADRWTYRTLFPPIASWSCLLRRAHERPRFSLTDEAFEDRYTIHDQTPSGGPLYIDTCWQVPDLALGDRWAGRSLPPVEDGAWHLVGPVMPGTWAPRLVELDRNLVVTDHYHGHGFTYHEAAYLLDHIVYAG